MNLLNASGESASQSVPHFHLRLIPRKSGDGIDAWPRLGGTSSAIESIQQKLKMIERL